MLNSKVKIKFTHLKSTFAFVKRPSLRLTTMNWLPLKRLLNSWPMCCVWDKSSAASISSRMYMGAGLNWSKDMIKERAIKDLHVMTLHQYTSALKESRMLTVDHH